MVQTFKLRWLVGAFALLTMFNSILLTSCEDNTTVVVQVPQLGKIQGRSAVTSRDQTPYWTFHGIPFADVSSYTGVNRFKPSALQTSALVDDDNGIFLANNLWVFCPQEEVFNLDGNDSKTMTQDLSEIFRNSYQRKRSQSRILRSFSSLEERKRYLMDSTQPMGQEECLTININTPAIPNNPNDKEQLVPVVVFYHGGGSDSVWGSAFTALRMLEHKVVLVTMNYRLGTLGAFNLGIDSAPGNAGQYDGIVALEWVQKNIRYFGGDPDRVTISGQSAGSMMVANLMITPLTKNRNLFHGVWGFSGSALSVWATAENPASKHHLKVAEYAGCRNPADSMDMEAITKCMQTASLDKLVAAHSLHKHEEESIGRLGFDAKMPSIQAPGLTIPYFMPKHPYEVLEASEQRSVPVVFGSTRHDGSFPLDDIYNNFIKPQGLDKNATFLKNELLPYLLKNLGVKDDTGELYHALGRAYLGDSASTGTMEDKLPGMLDMVTVMAFKAGMYETLRFQSKIQKHAYFYSLDYAGRWSLYNFLWGEMDIPGGICHTDDLIYFFWLGPLMNEDMKVSRRWMNYFINFVYHGSPNGNSSEIVWPPYDGLTHPYMKLGRKDRVLLNAPDHWIGAAQELFDKVDEDLPTTVTTTQKATTAVTTLVPDSTSATVEDMTKQSTNPTGTVTDSTTTPTGDNKNSGTIVQGTSVVILSLITVLIF